MNEEQFYQTSDNRVPAGRQLSRRDFLKISGTGVFIFFAPELPVRLRCSNAVGVIPPTSMRI